MYFYMYIKTFLIPGALWVVSLADSGTEVISLGGEHGAVCTKTFNGQYNTDSENIMSVLISVFFAVAKCSVHTKLFVESTFCSQPLTWGRDLKVKGDSPVELLVSLGLFNTILGLGGVCIYMCVHLFF